MVMGSAADTEEASTTAPQPEAGEETRPTVRTRCCALYHDSILQKVVAEVPSASSTNSL